MAVCSSFRDDKTGALSRQQVAILTKSKAYLSWPVSWERASAANPLSGGFAFAAIRVAGHNAGFFSVQFGDAVSARSEDARDKREESARQLLRQIATLGNWATNRPESFLIGGDFNTSPDDPFFRSERTLAVCLEAQNFANAFNGVSLPQRVTLAANNRRPDATVDYIFSKSARQNGRPLISRTALAEHCAVTCEMDFSTRPPVAPGFVSCGQPARFTRASECERWRPADLLGGGRARSRIDAAHRGGAVGDSILAATDQQPSGIASESHKQLQHFRPQHGDVRGSAPRSARSGR